MKNIIACFGLSLFITSCGEFVPNFALCNGNAEFFSGGDGSQDSPYLICSIEDLAKLDELLEDPASYDDFKDSNYLQVSDINLKGQSYDWLPLGSYDSSLSNRRDQAQLFTHVPSTKPFIGTYDGGGRKIIAMKIESNAISDYLGFFHMIGSGGVVKNLNFESPQFSLSDSVVVGTVAAYNSGTIKDINISNLSTAGSDKLVVFGGAIGFISDGLEVSNIVVSGNIVTSDNCSHVLGQPNNDTTTCDSLGISGVLGIILAVGQRVEINNLTNNANISAGNLAAGVAYAFFGDYSVQNLTNNGNIQAKGRAAGITYLFQDGRNLGMPGAFFPTISNLRNNGNILSYGASGEIGRSDATGIVGSIAGNYTSINSLINTGNITNNSEVTGSSVGIVIALNTESGTLSSWGNTGDIGMSAGKVDIDGNSYIHDDVAGLIGGIDGEFDLTLTDMYSRGKITGAIGEYDVGGIIADVWELNASLTLSNVFVASELYGGSGSGNGTIIGRIDIKNTPTQTVSVNISNAYWDGDLDPNDDRDGVYITAYERDTLIPNSGGVYSVSIGEQTTAEMFNSVTYSGFNFSNIWNLPYSGRYPSLR